MWWSIIGIGGSCFVSCTDKLTVLKSYEVWEDGELRASIPEPCEEALVRGETVYKRLGKHPQILQCFGLREIHPGIHALHLELAPWRNVREFITRNPVPSEDIRLQMTLDIALGLSYVHSKKVQHSDLSCRNLFLFPDFHVKIGDFGGSHIEGYQFDMTVYEEIRYELPSRGRAFQDRPIIKRELFALGSAVYEVMSWAMPFEKLEDDEVEARYAREEFPSLHNITIGPIIENCWKETYEDAGMVVEALQEHMRNRCSPEDT
ncbi:hypothetical protein MAP00_009292 [Monascus purpureus]|nr:hypothetical protein MAP00_009292 [Monascus purpureus]